MKIAHPPKRALILIFSSLFFLIFCLILFFTLSREGRTLFEAARFALRIYPVVKNQDVTFKNTTPPAKVFFPDGQNQTLGLIFTPPKKDKGGAVIVSGGVGMTRENFRFLFKFSEVLAQSGLTIFIPLPNTLLSDIVTQDGIKSYVNAFKFLEKEALIDPLKIGFMGFCAGGSFTILAAQDREIADRVAFVWAFAPYANLFDYYAQGFTQKAYLNGQLRDWTPEEITRRTLIKNYLVRLSSQKDREILSDFFLNSQMGKEPQLSKLSPQGKFAWELLATKDLEKSKTMLKLLPQNMQNDLQKLSPASQVANLKTQVYIIHDREDPFTPYEESIRLKGALNDKASLAQVTSFDHTILDKKFSLIQLIKELKLVLAQLYQIFYIFA
ncbi:hypothetical protein HY502_00165 [Candidatus Woesebacteria bacterium]|nr:hypothetical protein [Candidatus Woesebacteria bacterium]